MTGEESEARRSLVRREAEGAARGGGRAVVTAGSEFDPAVDDAKIEAMDKTAIATLFAEIPHARPRPLPIGKSL